jgi:hypothetical protein
LAQYCYGRSADTDREKTSKLIQKGLQWSSEVLGFLWLHQEAPEDVGVYPEEDFYQLKAAILQVWHQRTAETNFL